MIGFEEAAGITLISELFKKVWKGTANIPSWISQKLETSDPFRAEAKKYVQQIIERYNSMRIIGMNQPVPLDDIYINVNVRKRHEGSLDSNLWEWQDSQELVKYVSHSVPATTAIDEHPKVLILGRPGAGKTTFLKYLAITTLQKTLKHDLVPIFISLKDWTQDKTVKLETELIRQFDVCGLDKPREFVRNLLRKGKCLILLDGFDEVNVEFRSAAIQQIETLTHNYPKNRFVLSCRTAANTYVFKGFTEIEVADFNENQIKVFIRKWFNSTIADRCISELLKVDNSGIRDLASNPLLLTLICIAYEESFSFPENRVELYEISLDALLKKWDTSRDVIRSNPYKHLTVRKKEFLLSQIAAATFQRQSKIYLRKDMSSVIDNFMKELMDDDDYENGADGVLSAIEAQHGIITRVGEYEYAFSHLTFQEYYTAKYMTDKPDTELANKVLNKHIGDPRWNEVFLIYGSLQKDGAHFLYHLKLAIDELRDKHVETVINLSRSQIRNNELYANTINTILALYQLLDYEEAEFMGDDEPMNIDSLNKQVEHGELVSIAFLVSLIAKKLLEIYNLSASINNAAIIVTCIGQQQNMEKLREAIEDIESNENSWLSLQKYLFGVYVLVSCLAGEVTVQKRYREAILEQLFSNGCPEQPKLEDDFLLR